jgi:hypothetical protein
MKVLGGETYWVDAPRYCCTNKHPHRYHIGLPDCLIQFKHYQAELIQDAADGLLTEEDLDRLGLNYPCEQTLMRWRDWVDRNIQNIDGYLKSIGSQLPGFGIKLLNTAGSLLEKLRDDGEPWMAIIHRVIYNAGGFLPR